MAILGSNILNQHGPYVNFSVIDVPLCTDGWPDSSEYKQGIFIDVSDDLLGVYCSMTRSYSPFGTYDFTQFTTQQEVYEFTAKLLMWESQLAKTPVNYFASQLEYFHLPEFYLRGEVYTPEQLKNDLLETLHFMVGEMHKAAASGKCVVIVGI